MVSPVILSCYRWMSVWRSRRGEVVPCRPAVGRGAVWLCVWCRLSRESTPEPRHLPVSVQRESGVLSAAGQEVQPQHLQVGWRKKSRPARCGIKKAWSSAWFQAWISQLCTLTSLWREGQAMGECFLWGMKLSQVSAFWASANETHNFLEIPAGDEKTKWKKNVI